MKLGVLGGRWFSSSDPSYCHFDNWYIWQIIIKYVNLIQRGIKVPLSSLFRRKNSPIRHLYFITYMKHDNLLVLTRGMSVQINSFQIAKTILNEINDLLHLNINTFNNQV